MDWAVTGRHCSLQASIPLSVRVKTYAFAGFIAELLESSHSSRIEAGMPTAATGWEFQAVAVTLLGGTSLREGKGGVTGTIFGASYTSHQKWSEHSGCAVN